MGLLWQPSRGLRILSASLRGGCGTDLTGAVSCGAGAAMAYFPGRGRVPEAGGWKLEAGDFLTGEESSSLDPCSVEFVTNYVISFSHLICSDKSPTS